MRRRGLPALLICLFLSLAASAQATTYCVNKPSCVTAGGSAAGSVQSALTSAAALASGPDRVEIGPGSYTGPFIYFSPEELKIVGSGIGTTTLEHAADATVLLFSSENAASSVSDLTVRNNASSGQNALRIAGADATRVRAVSTNGNGGAAFAEASGAERPVLTSSLFESNGSGSSKGIEINNGSLADSTATSNSSFGAAVEASGGADVVRIRATSAAAFAAVHFAGSGRIEDSVLKGANGFPKTGLSLGGSGTTVTGRHLTIVGTSDSGVMVSGNFAGQTTTLNLLNTIIRGPAYDVCASTTVAGATAALQIEFGLLEIPPAIPGNDCPGNAEDGTHSIFTDELVAGGSDPLFLNAAGGDYRIPFNSPAVDTGARNTTFAAGESPFDLGGLARIRDGNGDGEVRRDLGAFEYQRRAPVVTATGPATIRLGQNAAFSATATELDPGETIVSRRWSVDGGAPIAGTSLLRSFTTVGNHSVKFTAIDSAGTAASRTLTVNVPKAQITKLSLSKRFRAATRGGTTTTNTAIGGRVKVKLSDAAKVTFAVEKRGRTGRYGRVGSKFTLNRAPGLSSFRFSGRVRGRTLTPGVYRMVAYPKAGGGTGTKVRKSFRIIP